MSELLQEINEDVQELITLKENIEPFLAECPTLVEDAAGLLMQVAAQVKAGKSLAGNEDIAQKLAGLFVILNPVNREAIAQLLKDAKTNLEIRDIIDNVGEDERVTRILKKLANRVAPSEVKKMSGTLNTIDKDEDKRRKFAAILLKTSNQFSRMKGMSPKQKPAL